ncbi:MAG: serine hydroxymethyltransferase [Candidatus Uhrbacteria bacterium]|nr:serine hydroxymethyltransferase [Candidatus Uhrbacteria bacterium]MDP3793565.1 serine hydroxymethyltransferase [Candidatus Uhrbacteria bacterium]
MISISQTDPEMSRLIDEEVRRQQEGLTLIPSENHSSKAVLEALGTVLTDKYAEGYPGKRYYAGNEVVDKVEGLVQERAKKLFGVPHANVQPYSGSPANFAVYLATCNPGDTIMGLDLLSGGHLTHGWKFSATSLFWKSVPYHVKEDGSTNFDELLTLAHQHKPKLIWCGGTAIPRAIPFKEMMDIADEVGAYLVADISHIAGLIVGGAHESPVPYVHLVTTTTHKTLRGPRGAMIMVTQKGLDKDPELAEKIDKAIIPGLQGGPHLNTIAGIGIALLEANQPEFKNYARRVVDNARTLASALTNHGFKLVSDGTDNHLILVDLTPTGIGRGVFLHLALERIGIYSNKNTIPADPSSPFYPSGLRLGSPAATTRGMGEKEMERIAEWIKRVTDHIKDVSMPSDKEARRIAIKEFKDSFATDPFYEVMKQAVKELCLKFPIPGI